VYQRPPISDEIADLRGQLARTSLQRPGQRRRLESRIRSLEIVRDAKAQHYPSSPIEAEAPELLAGPGLSSPDGAAACNPRQAPDAGSGLSDGGSPSQPRGDQRGLETGRIYFEGRVSSTALRHIAPPPALRAQGEASASYDDALPSSKVASLAVCAARR
jgi:hypothetical protein